MKRHDPFAYFVDVASSRSRCRRVVPLSQLDRDIAQNALPRFVWITPDLCHDMHDCSVSTGDVWLRRFVPALLGLPNTVVFVVFDEGTTAEGGGGHVPAYALGTAVRPGSVFSRTTSHYGLLRTIEDAWALPRLGRSGAVAPITSIWR